MKSTAAILFAVFLIPSLSQAWTWSAGVATEEITPSEPMWMAGYASRDKPAEGKGTELFAKALALRAMDGEIGLIITLDLIGIDRAFSQELARRIEEKHGLKRHQIAFCVSHTHSGPVVGRNLGPIHFLLLAKGKQSQVENYAEKLTETLVDLAGRAIDDLQPAFLSHGAGRCTFAVNRRENKPYDKVPEWREEGKLQGPVDHDVPVLCIRSMEREVRAILFGYACHATTLSGYDWNADYPGYAQSALEERFPGAVALFWAGCGGDQNPLPRGEVSLAERYGAELAERIEDVIAAPMKPIQLEFQMRFEEVPLPLQKIPSLDELNATAQSENRFEVARAKYLLREREKRGELAKDYPYPVAVWKIGSEVELIFLGGEVVVDYALRLKKERSGTSTWVAAYSNDVMAYIPSARVLVEGGYEGGGSNVYYGLPSNWAENVEETIVSAVGRVGSEERK